MNNSIWRFGLIKVLKCFAVSILFFLFSPFFNATGANYGENDPGNGFPFKFQIAPVNMFSDPPVSLLSTSGRLQVFSPPFSLVTEYDPLLNKYLLHHQAGNFRIGRPVVMSFQEYRRYNLDHQVSSYWQNRSRGITEDSGESFIHGLSVGGEAIDQIFGSNIVDIQPQGSAELIFGVNIMENERPDIQEELRRTTTFDFQEKIQMNVSGTVGDKLELGVNYNTEATFDFENQTKLEYTGTEDEIFRRIEAGNVTLPLPGTLITGSQSLFGLKTELQFGSLTVTNVFSQQKGESSVIEVRGGAHKKEFEVYADDYDANRHFFLSKYFRDTYEESLRNLPVIMTGINITRLEVWITNKTSNFDDSRNIVAFVDLAEDENNIYSTGNFTRDFSLQGNFPRNELNDLYEQMTTTYGDIRNINLVSTTLQAIPGFSIGTDYEVIENARRLTSREYSYNEQLGYISLNSALNADEVLAVAFEYTLDGETYQVGEFSNEGISAPGALVVKLLKGTSLSPRLPTWDLMMKNVYSIDAWQVERQDFHMDILYRDDNTGNAINYLPEGATEDKTLLQVMNLDNLNSQLEPYPDGVFDFIEGITIYPSTGRIFFPVLEPFGSHLRNFIGDDTVADKYVFQELYDSTQTRARQIAEKNKFMLSGHYRSSSGSEISLDAMNVPRGSVKVTAGGIELMENVDYTVDYTLGRVQIINQGLLDSGAPIRISLESQQLFDLQTRTLVGSHLDYQISDNFNVGATILNMTERPLTQKVVYGQESISNTIWGLNSSYRAESGFLTSLMDRIPLLNTSGPSTFSFQGEFAHLIPGHSRALGEAGVSYIDDFEATKTTIDLKSPRAWVISSTPDGQTLFPEAALTNDLAYGYNRARLAWYIIDPLFLRNTSATPDHIKNNPDLQSNHFVREVFENELFPERETPRGIPTNIPVLNLAFYPGERGPYNYDAAPSTYSAGVGPEGYLLEPETRWGGIMRSLHTTDFETSNIEYVEFWLMDPFVYDEEHSGGDLYINLGNVSEDVLKDGRKSFENGLPVSEEVVNVDTTAWGRVPTQQSLVNAFDNNPEARKYQDVGLDGLSTEDERSFFSDYLDELAMIHGEVSQAYELAYSDPSSDNYSYFRGTHWDEQEADILTRYKYYNGMEGNSPTSEQSPEPYPTSATSLPNTEDISRDNTLNKSEAYYQYRVSIRPDDMRVGDNYVVDSVRTTVKFPNGEQSSVNWYQVRIPLSDFEDRIGPIQDFKSIRFMRMFLTGFEDPVIMRFAKLDLVRSEWRRYNEVLIDDPDAIEPPAGEEGLFDISAVNIEENASKTPVNYVLPPGIDRVIDPENPQLQQLNEQSMLLKVHDLEDGVARAAFRNVNLDIRQYKRIQMEVHAAALPGEFLGDNELTVFIRLGTDYRNNYYEYEIPLSVTPPGRYNNDNVDHRRIVWPEDNRLDVELDVFHQVKQLRNEMLNQSGSDVTTGTVFSKMDGDNRVKVVGNPNLSNIRTIMIGIRNPAMQNNPFGSDDGLPRSGEVWVNELRLTDFNQSGGWAGNVRMSTRLSDFASITVAGSSVSPGFGSIEKKVNERSREQLYQYDISSNFELGKFFPDHLGIRIPLYFGYSEGFIMPQYNPLDPDVPLKDALERVESRSERDSIRNLSTDYSRRRSLNLNNMRISPEDSTPRFYNMSNWSVSIAYNDAYHRDINTEYNILRNYRGSLNYSYSPRTENVTPFSNWDIFSSPAFRIIRDFNFYYLPSYISFRTDLDRYYNAIQKRNIDNPDFLIIPSYQKDFTWNRYFDINFDLTRQLRLEFSANNTARIDEPEGIVDRKRDPYGYEAWKDSVFVNLRNFGRTTRYYHSTNLTYTLPVNKIPVLNWISSSVRYNATYGWDTGPVLPDNLDINLGNRIRNSNTTQVNAQFNLINLYNKSNFLREANQRAGSRDEQSPQQRRVRHEREKVNLTASEPFSVNHGLSTEEVSVRVLDSDGRPVRGRTEVISNRRINFTPDRDVQGAKVIVEGVVEVSQTVMRQVAQGGARLLMAVRNISASYSRSDGTMLPGYLPGTNILGQERVNNIFAPGFPFIFGYQDSDLPYRAIERGWLTTDTTMNEAFMMTHNNTLNFRSTIEPVNGLRIDLTATRTFAENSSEYFVADEQGQFTPSSRMTSGNFSMSFLSWSTAFERVSSKNNYHSKAFSNFKDYRLVIAERLADGRGLSEYYDPGDTRPDGYPDGYGSLSQDVLIPSFLAAYGGFDPGRISLKNFPLIPWPNWRITYDGLARLPFIGNLVSSANLNHAFRSTYSVSNYMTNFNYQEQDDGFSYIRDKIQDNFIPRHNISSVVISERFDPLINLDITWNNNFTTRAEYRKTRTVSLSFANNQISEIRSDEISIGMGYRFRDVQIVYRSRDGQRELMSDLNVRADFSVRENLTVIRKLAEDGVQPTAGQTIYSIKASADYVISNRFDVRFFVDRVINRPIVSLSYPTANTNIGFSLRFTLIQ